MFGGQVQCIKIRKTFIFYKIQNKLKFLNKRYVIKEDTKSLFSFLESFKLYKEYKEKYPLSEKEIKLTSNKNGI